MLKNVRTHLNNLFIKKCINTKLSKSLIGIAPHILTHKRHVGHIAYQNKVLCKINTMSQIVRKHFDSKRNGGRLNVKISRHFRYSAPFKVGFEVFCSTN